MFWKPQNETLQMLRKAFPALTITVANPPVTRFETYTVEREGTNFKRQYKVRNNAKYKAQHVQSMIIKDYERYFKKQLLYAGRK